MRIIKSKRTARHPIMFNLSITPEAIMLVPALLLSLVFHEVGHAWVAWKGGDDTARLMGRVSLNPLVHMDPIGTVLIPLIQIFTNVSFLIGWAKPVPVNPNRLKSKTWDLYVSLAGVAMNFILLVAATILLKAFLMFGFDGKMSPNLADMNGFDIGFLFLSAMIRINICLMIFNLLPIPPLDGSHVLLHFIRVRDSAAFRIFQFLEQYGFFILIFMMATGMFRVILGPIFIVIYTLIGLFLSL